MQTLNIHHLGLAVSNLDSTTDFFEKCLGWSVVKRDLEYPANFVKNDEIMITLWQTNSHANKFDYRQNVGLHHFALKVPSEDALNSLFLEVKAYPGVIIEFEPELLREGPANHCMIYEPGGIRMEFIWVP